MTINEFFRIENTSKILGKEAPIKARKLIQEGDVIFATVRPTLKRIAKISYDYHNQICSTGYCVLKSDSDKLIQDTLLHELMTGQRRVHELEFEALVKDTIQDV